MRWMFGVTPRKGMGDRNEERQKEKKVGVWEQGGWKEDEMEERQLEGKKQMGTDVPSDSSKPHSPKVPAIKHIPEMLNLGYGRYEGCVPCLQHLWYKECLKVLL